MAKKAVLVVVCDKCGFEETDTTKFLHVQVSEINPDHKQKASILTERDLCLESCVGAPGVNRDR